MRRPMMRFNIIWSWEKAQFALEDDEKLVIENIPIPESH